jgi:uncharacterized protein YbjT (DUF2867 family)
MKIVILGATGRTGTHLVNQALTADHTVTAFVRRADNLKVHDPRLIVKTGDARDSADLTAALRGQDAAISVLGSNRPGAKLMQKSITALVEAAHASAVRRVIVLSSLVATPNYRPTGAYRLIGKLMQSLIDDKRIAEDLLRKSNLDWTVVHATLLDKAPAGRTIRTVDANQEIGMRNGIARADVASFLLAQTGTPSTIGTTMLITTK